MSANLIKWRDVLHLSPPWDEEDVYDAAYEAHYGKYTLIVFHFLEADLVFGDWQWKVMLHGDVIAGYCSRHAHEAVEAAELVLQKHLLFRDLKVNKNKREDVALPE